MKEKEMLDIGDTNSLLLHPNQFSIANQASPGGAGTSRKTRHARHKVIDRDNPPEPASATENGRKRKAVMVEEADESPAPYSRAPEGGNTFFRDVKNKLVHNQYEAPAFSVDRLFTEKELHMNMNTAWLAATNFLAKLRSPPNGTTFHANGVNGAHDIDKPMDSVEGAADEDAEEALEAPGMDRTVSHHATRGATRNALTDLANLADLSSLYPIPGPTIMPAMIGAKANAAAPAPVVLTTSEIEQDLKLFTRNAGADDPLNNQLLEQATKPTGSSEYQYRPPNQLADERELGGHHRDLLAAMGGVPMSAQSSQGGYSEAGGLPMSRTNSAMGGLRRTASGTGVNFLGGAESGRRARQRLL